MTTGQRIKAARKKANMTQATLASELGIPFQSISQWERDIRNPKKETLEKIGAILGVYYLDLYGDDEVSLIKEGVEVGKKTHNYAANALTRMDVVAEFEARGYTFDPLESRLVRAFCKLNDQGQHLTLVFAEGIAENPKFLLEPPGWEDADDIPVEDFPGDSVPFPSPTEAKEPPQPK